MAIVFFILLLPFCFSVLFGCLSCISVSLGTKKAAHGARPHARRTDGKNKRGALQEGPAQMTVSVTDLTPLRWNSVPLFTMCLT
jgi:hypothetical protein